MLLVDMFILKSLKEMNFKKIFFVWRSDSRNGIRKLIDIFDEESIAFAVCKTCLEENRKVCFDFYVEECDFESSRYFIDDYILTRCFNIANCLDLFDKSIKKSQYDKALEWFNLAVDRSSITSKYIDFFCNE